MLEEADGRVLLELKTAVDRTAYVDEQAEVQGQIGFSAKVKNGLRRLVIVENREIVLIEIANKFAMLVSGDEEDIHFIDAFVNGEHRARLIIIGCRIGGGRAAVGGA